MENKIYNILMTEDDTAICVIVAIILHRLGHHVEMVADGREAIKRCAMQPDYFDILITDHNVSHTAGSGLDLVHHLRRNDFKGKIIIMSGSMTNDLVYAYRDRRVDKVLQKPFTSKDLSSSLQSLFTLWGDADMPDIA
jgi:CheY-like chemotaxis protein